MNADIHYQEAVQFRMTYFAHANVTLTLVAGDSFGDLRSRTANEILIVRDSWYPSDPEAAVARLRERQAPDRGRLVFLSNTAEIHQIRRNHGFDSHFVNIGCFIDEHVFKPYVPPWFRSRDHAPKPYDAVMNARFTTSSEPPRVELKRHDLTGRIARLALLDPVFETNDSAYKRKYCERTNCKYYNSRRLSPPQVAGILQQAHVGLVLSAQEGICRASSEYLLAGLPVVSTPSIGGRDVWYDDYNSIIVDPTEEAVAAGVEALKARPRDPLRIRTDYLRRAALFRARFRDDVLAPILRARAIELSADVVMRRHPFRWYP